MVPSTVSPEAHQRLFYSLDEDAIDRVVREVIQEELSVVDGGVLERFEKAVADSFGARHCVAVTNGTAALHLALFALEIQPGDEVLIPAFGYYAMALPVCMLGAVPVFCDVREDNLTIDPEDAASMVTQRTRAIIALQTWGSPADVDGLRALADRHNLSLISDSSHAQGALWKGKPLGQAYDFVCASYGKGKLISGGELGVVTAYTDRHRDRMLLYGHVNRVPRALLTDEYRHIENSVGVKYRPHPFAMALALEQMKTYAERSERLVKKIRSFEERLAQIPGFAPFPTPEEASRVYWRVPLRIDTERLGTQDHVFKQLKERNCPVEKRRGPLIPRHTAVTDFYGVKTERSFPVAERVGGEILQVRAFPFCDENFMEPLLAQFEAISQAQPRPQV